MSDWTLKVNNICGFKGQHDFRLKEGLNWIVGKNATGKTSIINSIKLLNNLNLKETGRETNKDEDVYLQFLHDKTQNGSIDLINGNNHYNIDFFSSVIKITNYIDGNDPLLKKRKKNLIYQDPSVNKFAFIDKQNELMESIEYSGSMDLIRQEIMSISNIKYYELILENVRKLNFEYKDERENKLLKLNNERKEVELMFKKNLKKIEELEKDLLNFQNDDKNSEEINKLKAEFEQKKQEYNSLYFKEYNNLKEKINKIAISMEKDEEELKNLKKQKEDLDAFINLENNIIENEKRVNNIDNRLAKLREALNNFFLNKKEIINSIGILEETINNRDESGICKHCLNLIDIKMLSKEIQKLNSNKTEYIEKIREIENSIKNQQIEREKINDLLLNQKKIPLNIKKIMVSVNNLTKKLETNKENKFKFEQQFNEIQKNLSSIQKDIEGIQHDIIKNSNQDEETKKNQAEILTKINLFKEENEKLNSKKDFLIQKILYLPQNYNKLIERTEALINILNKNIESFYVEFIDFINSELATLLEKLNWTFKEIYVDDNLNLKTVNSEGNPQSFNTLSDFERKSIAIMILLIIKMKYFPDYPIFAIDEHLNSADSKRFINFVSLLYENVIKSKIKLFIITSLPNEFDIEFINQLNKTQYNDLVILQKS